MHAIMQDNNLWKSLTIQFNILSGYWCSKKYKSNINLRLQKLSRQVFFAQEKITNRQLAKI